MKQKQRLFLLIPLLGLAVCSGAGDPPSGNAGRGPGGGRRGGPSGFGSESPESVSVKASRAARRPISAYILSNTTLESIRKVTVFAKVNALVREILVEEGDQVGRDQTLARLDDREIRNDFSQAQIALQQAELALQQAEVKSELSQANYERSKSLFEQRLISQQEFDQVALSNKTDALALQVAREQKDASQARLDAAQIQIDYTNITSSIAGVVTERLIEVGSRVQPGQAVFTVEDFDPLWAKIYVPERELPQLKEGQTAKLRFQAFPDRRFEGRILMINPTVDSQSGTVKVTLEVARRPGGLRPGMFGTAYIATETRPNAIVIPKRAVLRERDDNRVFVIQPDNTVQKRDVTLGFTEEDWVEAVDGLQDGEAVVTVGLEGLSDGYSVNVLEWEGEGSAPTVAAPEAIVSNPPRPRPETAPPASGRPEPSPGGDAERRGGGQNWRDRQGAPSPEQIKAFLTRMLSNPEVKSIYDERLKQDPDLATDPEKQRAFLREMRGQFGQRRGGQ